MRARSVAAAAVLALLAIAPLHSQSDLDQFMKQVLSRRDENWKRLQQYVLDERGVVDIKGPGGATLWSDRREFTWFIRDGFFIRSPTKANGVTIGEDDRRKYEDDYLKRVQRRDSRRRRDDAAAPADPAPPPPPSDVEGLLRQTREPEFISSAYFLRFRFEEGKYALVGRETLDGHQVLKVEYYPANLFRGTDRRRHADADDKREDAAYDEAFRRLMNKTALVTLWIEPGAHQIIKYTFDNIAMDFLPAQWLLH